MSALLACGALCACGVSQDAGGDLQSICGPSTELQDVQTYDGRFGVSRSFVNRHRLAVGVLKWRDDLALRYREEAGNVSGQGWCTGSLIDSDLFLTAAHCLETEEGSPWVLPREKGGIALSTRDTAREFRVRFRFEKSAVAGSVLEDDSETNTFDVVRLEEYRYNNLDYAILRLSDNVGSRYGVARISPTDVQPGDAIAVLQHPSAEPMKIGAGTVAQVAHSRISYDTIDTLGGSSGAAILEVATGKLVGVHTNGGCNPDGDRKNSGVTVEALADASPTIRELADSSRDFLVGDFDHDSVSDLSIYRAGCVHPDVNHDGEADEAWSLCPGGGDAADLFVGRWKIGGASSLGWRLGDCIYLDTNPDRPLCFDGENARFDLLVADWNGDGRSDLGIQQSRCIDFDTDLDGTLDERGYCFGEGLGEDQYLVGNWNGGAYDTIAVRRGNILLVDIDRDGSPDETMVFGEGGNEHQYFVADWNGDLRSDLAIRKVGTDDRVSTGLFRYDEDGTADDSEIFRDTWAE